MMMAAPTCLNIDRNKTHEARDDKNVLNWAFHAFSEIGVAKIEI